MNFQSSYKRNQYINFFRNQCLPEDFEEHDEDVSISFKPQRILKVVKIGEVQSLDLNVYEIEHESEYDRRVLISRDSFRFLAHYGVQKALIIFTSKNSQNFRLSLVTVDLIWDEGKKVKKEYSNPRRYSFFLDPDTKIHTPEEYLVKKGRVKDFDDLKGRFSIEVVNKEFYTQIAILFTKLAGGTRRIGREKFDEKGSLKLPSTSDDILQKEFTVRLIGRLVFCWFLKKKTSDSGISLLPEELLSSEAISKSRNFYHSVLEPLFFAALNTPIEERSKKYNQLPWSQVPFLNGGLFNPGGHDYYDTDSLGTSKYLNTLKVPDVWLKKLFEVFETYNFTIDENTSIDVELSIEPEMLGRIFENLLAEINPETGETARKSTGSYYTPRSIVEYMVDQSLKQYLLTKTDIKEEKISSLLSYEDEKVELTDAQKERVLDALDNIKIVDPACGSGAFPMGILQKMLLMLQKVDPESKNWLGRQVAKIDNKVVRKEVEKKLKKENWNYVHKRGIIQDSIYGVDIQPIAVEISKLRFFLSLIVDERINDKADNRGLSPLPNLEFKFVAANTLIGLPKYKTMEETVGLFEATDDISLLRELRDRYFSSHTSEKQQIENEFKEVQIRMFERSLGWKASGSQTMQLSQWNPFSDEAATWFDSEWMFGVKDGFDVVIANPPYVSALKFTSIYGPDIRDNLNASYISAKGAYDIFILFIEKAMKIINNQGRLVYITPNKYLSAKYAISLREYILNHGGLYHLVDLSSIRVFEEASVYPIISCISAEKSKYNSVSVLLPNSREVDQFKLSNFYETNIPKNILKLLPEYIWGFLLSPNIDLLQKLMMDTELLKDIGDINATSTAGEAEEYGKFITNKNQSYCMKIINTGTIDRYSSLWGINKMTHSGSKFLTPYLPLKKAAVNDRRKDMYNSPKIIFAKMAKECEAYIDINGEYASINTNCFYNPRSDVSLKFIGAFCNSKLFMFIYHQFFGALRMSGGYFQFQAPQIRVMPLKRNNKAFQLPIVRLVDQILSAKQKNPNADTSVFEKQIDDMVYKLYDLTPEEIAIVEGKK